MTERQLARVPVINETTGRLPDKYAPEAIAAVPGLAAAAAAAASAANLAQIAAGDAQTAANAAQAAAQAAAALVGAPAGDAIRAVLAADLADIASPVATALAGKAPETHTHTWTSITSKPTTFTPSTHTHAWADVTGKPATFAPSTHSHTAATSGADGFMPMADKAKLDAATHLSTVSTYMTRDSFGRSNVADPLATTHIVNKQYLDTRLTGHKVALGKSSTVNGTGAAFADVNIDFTGFSTTPTLVAWASTEDFIVSQTGFITAFGTTLRVKRRDGATFSSGVSVGFNWIAMAV